MTTIIDREVKQLRDIAASLSATKKRLSGKKETLSYIERNLPRYQSYGKSITGAYAELIENTKWLSGEFGCLAQIYRDVYSLTKEIDEKIWDKPVMSEEKLKTLLHLGKEGSFTASDIHEIYYEEFSRKAARYFSEGGDHSEEEPMSPPFVKWFKKRTMDLIEGVGTAIKVVDQAELFMKRVLEPLPR